jgi:hypothetical protein
MVLGGGQGPAFAAQSMAFMALRPSQALQQTGRRQGNQWRMACLWVAGMAQAFHQTNCVHDRDRSFGHAINGLRNPGIHRSKHGTKAGGSGSQDRVKGGTLIHSSISTNT